MGVVSRLVEQTAQRAIVARVQDDELPFGLEHPPHSGQRQAWIVKRVRGDKPV
jgi:hypothetical protein